MDRRQFMKGTLLASAAFLLPDIKPLDAKADSVEWPIYVSLNAFTYTPPDDGAIVFTTPNRWGDVELIGIFELL